MSVNLEEKEKCVHAEASYNNNDWKQPTLNSFLGSVATSDPKMSARTSVQFISVVFRCSEVCFTRKRYRAQANDARASHFASFPFRICLLHLFIGYPSSYRLIGEKLKSVKLNRIFNRGKIYSEARFWFGGSIVIKSSDISFFWCICV